MNQHTNQTAPSVTPKGDDTAVYSDYGSVPTTSLGPVTITIIVILVLVTCSILQCSRVKHTMRSRRMMLARNISSNINTADENSSSWSPSSSTLHGAEDRQKQQDKKQEHQQQQQQCPSLLTPPPPAIMVQRHQPSGCVANTAPPSSFPSSV